MVAARRSLLLKALGLLPGDVPVLARLGAASFVLNAGGELAWGALMGCFVVEAGPEAMPRMYVAVSAGSAVAFLAFAFLVGRGSTRRLLAWILAAACLFLAIAAVPLQGSPGAAFGALLAAWIYQVVYETEFPGWVGGVLPLQDAKRLLPGITAAAALGRVAGALLAADPLGLGSISARMVLAALLSLATAPLLVAFHRSRPPPGERLPERSTSPSGLGSTFSSVVASPLFSRLAIVAFLVGATSAASDYPRTVMAARAFSTPEELASFYGHVSALTNSLTVVLQLLGTGVLVRRLGLEATLAILPLAVGTAALAAAASPGFVLAVVIRAGQLLLSRFAHGPACLLLVNAAPTSEAPRLRAVAYGLATTSGLLTAGAVLALAGTPRLEAVYLAMAGSCGLALLAVRGVTEAYRSSLADELLRQTAPTGAGTGEESSSLSALAMQAATGSGVAQVLLASGDPRLIGAVRRALVEMGSGDLEVGIASALETEGEDACLFALERLAAAHLPGPAARRLGEVLIAGSDPGSRRRALRATGELGDPRSAAALLARLGDPGLPPEERPGVASALLRVAIEPDPLARAVTSLRGDLSHPRAAVRARAMAAVGRLGLPAMVPALASGLSDPDPEVAVQAARALGRARCPTAVPALEACLDRSPAAALRQEAVASLARIRDETLASIEAMLDLFSERDRRRLGRALEGLGSGTSAVLLARALALPLPRLRAAVVGALRDLVGRGRIEAAADWLPAPGQVEVARLVEAAWSAEEEHRTPLVRVLAELPSRTAEAAAAPALARCLGADLGAIGDAPVVRAERVRRALHLLDRAGSRDESLETAFELARGADGRTASRARELLETGILDPSLLRLVLADLPRT